MVVFVQQPSGGDNVSKNNPRDVLYVRGSEFVDSSIRIIFGTNGQTQVQRRVDGIWNPSELELGEETLLLGPNLSMSALGSSVLIGSTLGVSAIPQQQGPLSVRESIPLDIPLTTGGTLAPRVLRAGAELIRVIGQPIFTDEIVSKEILLPVTTTFQGFVYVIYLKVGAVAATEEVNISVTAGLIPGGVLLYERLYPASDFPANTEIQLPGPLELGMFIGDEVLLTISSTANISLLGNSAGRIWFANDLQNYIYEEVISTPTGTDKFVTSFLNENIVLNLSGNLILSGAAL